MKSKKVDKTLRILKHVPMIFLGLTFMIMVLLMNSNAADYILN
jgi:hypothetical protein